MLVGCERALTYEVDSVRGVMHGFINVFVAAALIRNGADERAVAAAFLGAVRVFAAEGPVCLAVDDVQWLDEGTAQVLTTVYGTVPQAALLTVTTERPGPGPIQDPGPVASPLDLPFVTFDQSPRW